MHFHSISSWKQCLTNPIHPHSASQVSPAYSESRGLSTLLPLPHPFVMPGARFREAYYWDNLWVVKGLLACGANGLAEGVVRNTLVQAKTFGFVPNGTRTYYMNRRQAGTRVGWGWGRARQRYTAHFPPPVSGRI